METLSDLLLLYDVPKEIMYLIKHHSYHPSEAYYILHPSIEQERYYSKISKLLQKNLCLNWYSKQPDMNTESLQIGIHAQSMYHFVIYKCIDMYIYYNIIII